MFNSDLKKESIKDLEKSIKKYEEQAEITRNKAEKLFTIRQHSGEDLIFSVEKYINKLSNTPKEFNKTFLQYKSEFKVFSNLIESFNVESADAEIKAGGGAVAGVAAGVGTAALMPTAAMAVATTFGAASTGTAIATLSGAAATNASLAWLGGGALVAGGSGMSGGAAFLALAGPIGIGIGAVGLIGGGLFASSKNKDLAEKANNQRKEIETTVKALEASILEINGLIKLTNEHSRGVEEMLLTLSKSASSNYLSFSQSHKQMLSALINHIESLSMLINKKVT